MTYKLPGQFKQNLMEGETDVLTALGSFRWSWAAVTCLNPPGYLHKRKIHLSEYHKLPVLIQIKIVFNISVLEQRGTKQKKEIYQLWKTEWDGSC